MAQNVDLTEYVAREVEDLKGEIAASMRHIRMERAHENELSVLSAAFAVLKEIGEVELVEQFLKASKRIGSKLRSRGQMGQDTY